jgi:hypothetical protein
VNCLRPRPPPKRVHLRPFPSCANNRVVVGPRRAPKVLDLDTAIKAITWMIAVGCDNALPTRSHEANASEAKDHHRPCGGFVDGRYGNDRNRCLRSRSLLQTR